MKLVCSTACSFHLTFWVSVSGIQIKEEEAILTVYSESQRWGRKQMRRETDRERERLHVKGHGPGNKHSTVLKPSNIQSQKELHFFWGTKALFLYWTCVHVRVKYVLVVCVHIHLWYVHVMLLFIWCRF